jgi:nucleotide-binding universal stress UspA family protein
LFSIILDFPKFTPDFLHSSTDKLAYTRFLNVLRTAKKLSTSTGPFFDEVLSLISKILVGYDGTEGSNRALDFGLDLAEKYAASLLILNVLEMPVYSNPEEPLAVSAGVAGLAKDLRESHTATLTKAAEKAARDKPNLQVVTELREGDPRTQLVAAASEGNYDAIIVGHGGEGRLRELILGGTSESVAHRAKCAVIIVK